MTRTQRTYISKHTYKTPSGLYYNDQTGKRLTGKRGRANESNSKRMQARIRDESGKLSFRRVKVESDSQMIGNKTISPTTVTLEADTIYDHEKNETYFQEYVRKNLDREDEGYEHFNIRFLSNLEERK